MIFTCWRRDNPDITLALGVATPVKAVEAGVVSYAGDATKGSGALIAIRHRSGFISLYAGVAALKVQRGEAVQQGRIIADVGKAVSPRLLFELRRNGRVIDPLPYLPCR
jgi:lipoprotein NlpD